MGADRWQLERRELAAKLAGSRDACATPPEKLARRLDTKCDKLDVERNLRRAQFAASYANENMHVDCHLSKAAASERKRLVWLAATVLLLVIGVVLPETGSRSLAHSTHQQQQQQQQPNSADSSAPNQQADNATLTPTTTLTSSALTNSANKIKRKNKTSEKLEAGSRKSTSKESSKGKSGFNCQYERGEWQECRNGAQERSLRLRKDSSGALKRRCEPIKTIRRNCLKGCKYMRGDWSPDCINGLRVREDTLMRASANTATSGVNLNRARRFNLDDAPANVLRMAPGECPAKRLVTKDCRRACHYLKSAWSECQDGFKTRNLTLADWPTLEPPDNSRAPLSAKLDHCKRSVLIRRQCAGVRGQTSAGSAKVAPTVELAKLTAAQRRQRRKQQQQQQEHQNGQRNVKR